jgi:proteasome lid subunit RPN8/RPN11
MNTEIKNTIEKFAKENANEEICGFVYHSLSELYIYPCKNIADDKSLDFEISSEDYIICKNKGKILFIYHSHTAASTFGASFTPADIELADEIELPIRVYSITEDKWQEYIPKEYKISLIGQPFLWGEKDCFGLVRTFLRQEKGIYIGDYSRDKTFQNNNNNQILENIEKEGYYSTNSTCLLMRHDILLFTSGKLNVQHMAVYMGNSQILHHPLNMLSNIEPMNQRTLDRLKYVFRHKELSI